MSGKGPLPLRRGTTVPVLSRTGSSLTLDQMASDGVLIRLAQMNPRVTKVILKGCQSISDRGISELVLACPNLETLNIQLVSDRVTPAVAEILSHASHLQRIIISNLPDKTLEMALRRQFPISGRIAIISI